MNEKNETRIQALKKKIYTAKVSNEFRKANYYQ